jgi:hypothetical protein
MLGPAIEQAIFTSVRGRTMDGYQVAAASPGVTADEAQELAVWGPAHDSLLDPRPGAQSINFHPLKSDRFCVSLTTALDLEYSGRGGCQIHTHNLVAAAETLARFANDPFRLLEAALAAGKLAAVAKIPSSLESFHLLGGASAVNGALLARLARHPGPAAVARFVEAALQHRVLAVKSQAPLRQLFAGLFNVLPVECRLEFPFTTGLRHSSRRAFRLSPLPQDAEERHRTTTHGVAIPLDLASATSTAPASGWGGYVYRVLEEHRVSQLSSALREGRPGLTTRDLNSLAERLASPTRPALAAIH